MLTGNFPVHDAPPINFLTSGLLGASPRGSGPLLPDVPPVVGGSLLGFGSLSEFEKTMKLSSPDFVAGEGLDAPWPPAGLPPFDCPFLTIAGQNKAYKGVLHVK